MFVSRQVLSGLVLLLAAALIGCGDPQSSTNFSRARVVNALVGIPNNAGINVAVNNHFQPPPFINIPFGGVSPYNTGGIGQTNFTVTQVGTNTPLVPQTQVFLQTQTSNTVAAAGVIGGTGTLAPQLFTLVDTAPPTNFASTNANTINFAVKVYNLSPDSAPINFEGGKGGTGVVPGLNNIAYANATNYVIISVPADPDPRGGFLPTATVQFTLNDSATGNVIPVRALQTLNSVANGELFTVYVVGLNHPTGSQQGLTVNIAQGVF